MSKPKKSTIEVQGTAITVLTQAVDDYISLTDIAKHKEPDRSDHVIQNWMRNRNTVEFLGVWERLHNLAFNPLEFEGFKNKAGLNSFVLTPRQWIDATSAIGLVSKSGRYGGTYAHKDIAFEFASWVSVEFKLYLIKEFQRLKDLTERIKAFALRIICMFSTLSKTPELQVLGKQVFRSGTSAGANYREAYRGRSKAEFVAKCGDCLRELEKTAYWFELLVDSGIVVPDNLASLRAECDELTAIFVTIIKRSKENQS